MSKWIHTGILCGNGKLRDVVADGGEFNIICQNALSSSAISLRKNVIHIIVTYIASEIIIFITTKHHSKHVAVTVQFVLK